MTRTPMPFLSEFASTKKISIIALALAATLTGPEAAAGVTCKPLFGHFESTVVTNFDPTVPGTCFSPVGFCTDGTVIGGLQGTFRLTIEEFIAGTFVPETGQPQVQFFIGESVVTDKISGDQLIGTDTGALNLLNGQIATLLTFDGGTGAFDGASGHIVITGVADFANGANIGDFRGEVCTAAS